MIPKQVRALNCAQRVIQDISGWEKGLRIASSSLQAQACACNILCSGRKVPREGSNPWFWPGKVELEWRIACLAREKEVRSTLLKKALLPPKIKKRRMQTNALSCALSGKGQRGGATQGFGRGIASSSRKAGTYTVNCGLSSSVYLSVG